MFSNYSDQTMQMFSPYIIKYLLTHLRLKSFSTLFIRLQFEMQRQKRHLMTSVLIQIQISLSIRTIWPEVWLSTLCGHPRLLQANSANSDQALRIIIKPGHSISYKIACERSEDSDQPAPSDKGLHRALCYIYIK